MGATTPDAAGDGGRRMVAGEQARAEAGASTAGADQAIRISAWVMHADIAAVRSPARPGPSVPPPMPPDTRSDRSSPCPSWKACCCKLTGRTARCPGWRLGDAWTDVGRTPDEPHPGDQARRAGQRDPLARPVRRDPPPPRGAHITLLTTAPYAAWFGTSPYFDDVWIDARPDWWDPAAPPASPPARRALRRVYDLQTSGRSAAISTCSPGPRPDGAASRAAARSQTATRTATACTTRTASSASCAPPA